MSTRAVVLIVLALSVVAGTVFLERTHRTPPAASSPTQGQTYQCSMHPQIVSHEPGVCPICQMKLTLVDEPAAAVPAAEQRRITGYRHPMRPEIVSPVPAKDEMGMDYLPVYEEPRGAGSGRVPGHAGFTLSTERQQLIGVTHAPVVVRPLAVEIRAVGRVAYDPKLYAAIVEYREALRARAQIKASPWFEAREGADALIRAATLKLRQQGVSEEQLVAIRREGGDPVNLLLPGKSVWVYAQVYEYEVALVRPGQTATITTPSLPGRTFTAEVVSVDPILDTATRTARVRIPVATPDADLRPETFVTVRLRVPLGDQLAVPDDAVLDTGEHRIVFVVTGDGRFEPRAVELGRDAQGYHEVLAGLAPGEEVVTSANFLIDSESRFRAALAAFKGAGAHVHPQAP